MYGIFTYTFTIKINQMQVNIPVPWILWDMVQRYNHRDETEMT